MDAVKFIEESRRMCKSFGTTCKGCPANVDDDRCKFGLFWGDEAAEQIKLQEEWSAAHPRKTRQSVFLEQYPEAEIDEQGYLPLCPRRISADCRSRVRLCTKRLCSDCCREFWMQEVE